MDIKTHFRSVTAELDALKGRVRNFIQDAHWLTDGEWKESVLRSCLRRCLPATVEVGRGFVVGPNATSDQVDVLIYAADKPVLFRDGDLVFVTHDALIGMIEVKTAVTRTSFHKAVKKLADNTVRIAPYSRSHIIYGLFAYENKGVTPEYALRALQDAAGGDAHRVIDIVALGSDLFARWWRLDPIHEPGHGRREAKRWHTYHLAGMAPGYFIHNIVEFLNPESVEQNDGVWFPIDGKECFKNGEMSLAT